MGIQLSKVPAELSVPPANLEANLHLKSRPVFLPACDPHKSKRQAFTAESTGRASGTAPNPSEFCMGTKQASSRDGRLEEIMGRFSSGSHLDKLDYWGKE